MFFEDVELAPPDPVFGLNKIFQEDSRKNKVYLGVGFYQNEEGNANIMQCIQKAQKRVIEKEKEANYLPFHGNSAFLKQIGQLVFTEKYWKENSQKICGLQTPGGTAALRVTGEFLKNQKFSSIYLPNPTWANHLLIFERSNLTCQKYDYYDEDCHGLNFDKMIASLEKVPPKSCVLLQTSCHNPTGSDLTKDQWKTLSKLFLDRKLLAIFDTAYQGFGDDYDEDAFAVRYFAAQGHEFFVTYTCSKNFSLYNQRVGAVFGVFSNQEKIASQLGRCVRSIYSSPPLHGADLACEVLENLELRKIWEEELAKMRQRLNFYRAALADLLGKDFHFIKNQKGMFSFCGLKKDQVERLMQEFGVYVLLSGRVNFAGINKKNLQYVADAILAVV